MKLASNVPLTADARVNPLLTRTSLLGRLLESYDQIFVLCNRATCDVHSPTGAADGRRMWWPGIQRRVVTFDAENLDREHHSILLWAGCDQQKRSSARDGGRITTKMCSSFSRAGGGNDWRRTSRHRLAALLAHLRLVAEAAKRNLTSIMILEADAVPALAVDRLSHNKSHALLLARQMQHALSVHPWKVLRLSGMFYTQEYAPKPPAGVRGAGKGTSARGCSSQCACRLWAGSVHTEPMAPDMKLCEVIAQAAHVLAARCSRRSATTPFSRDPARAFSCKLHTSPMTCTVHCHCRFLLLRRLPTPYCR